jgi:hypothetical protein
MHIWKNWLVEVEEIFGVPKLTWMETKGFWNPPDTGGLLKCINYVFLIVLWFGLFDLQQVWTAL